MQKSNLNITNYAELSHPQKNSETNSSEINYQHILSGNNANGKLVIITGINENRENEIILATNLADSLNAQSKKTTAILPKLIQKQQNHSPVENNKLINAEAIFRSSRLISNSLDDHIKHGNELRINIEEIVWAPDWDQKNRKNSLSSKINEPLPENISQATESQRTFPLYVTNEIIPIINTTLNYEDLKIKLAKMIVAYDLWGKVITANNLKIADELALVLSPCLNPHFSHTAQSSPVLLPNTIDENSNQISNLMNPMLALKLSEYVIYLGQDLNCEKSLNITFRQGNIQPKLTIIAFDLETIKANQENLLKQVENMKIFGIPFLLVLTKKPTDQVNQVNLISSWLKSNQLEVEIIKLPNPSQEQFINLTQKVIDLAGKSSPFNYLYDIDKPVIDKINIVAKNIYDIDEVIISQNALITINHLTELNFPKSTICFQNQVLDHQVNKHHKDSEFQKILKVKKVKPARGSSILIVETSISKKYLP